MTIKDIVKTAAVFLNLTDVTTYLESNSVTPSQTTLTAVDSLTRLSNLVVVELAASYVPMTCSETVETADGKIVFGNLSHNVTRILSVKNQFGHDAEFRLYPEYLKVFGGIYTVEYEYAPANYGLNDAVGFNGRITAALLGYGVAAEYCVTQGRFDEAVLWRKRYTFGVERVALPKSADLKGRCWL